MPIDTSDRDRSTAREFGAALAESQATGPDPVTNTQQAYVTLLFNKYRGPLHRYLSSFVGSREDAADLLQESYFRLMRHGNIVQIEAMARSFLFRTAANLARDHLRRRKTQPPDHDISIVDCELASEATTPEQQFVLDQTLAALRRAIISLPAVTRNVFLLSRFREMTYVEIGRVLGISTRSVERRMAEALDGLGQVAGEAQ